MRHFDELFDTAALHKGGHTEVEALLPQAQSAQWLSAQPDAWYLSMMSLRIFRAGLKHAMVDARWPAFEAAFNGFDPFFCAMQSDEDIERHCGNRALIRHLGKLKSIRENAQFVRAVAEEHGSFGAWIAQWPVQDTVELWFEIGRRGRQLGGSSAAQFLRMVGRDTFLLTQDVTQVLIAEGVLAKAATSKRDQRAAQQAFNAWREQSGRSLCEISRIVSMNTF